MMDLGSALLTRQVVKSAFELPRGAVLAAGRTHMLRGRSWSGGGPIGSVEVSTDGGATWHRAIPVGAARPCARLRWALPWRPARTGPHTLLVRATGTTTYRSGAVVRHPVTVLAAQMRR